MKTIRVFATVSLVLLLLGATVPLHAQAPGVPGVPTVPTISAYGGYNVDAEDLLIGGNVRLPVQLGMSALVFIPGLEFYPGFENGSRFTVLADVHFVLPIPNPGIRPYVGGGLAIDVVSLDIGDSNTNTKLNGVGGFDFGSGPIHPFVEGNLRIIDGSELILKFGGRIKIGG